MTHTTPSPLPEQQGLSYLDPDSKKSLVNRLARLQGHLRSVGKMLDEERLDRVTKVLATLLKQS